MIPNTVDANPIGRGVRETFAGMPPVTRALLALIIVVFILQQVRLITDAYSCYGGFWQGYDKRDPTDVIPPTSWPNAIASFFISPYAHLGILHLLMNGLVLVIEGGRLEKSVEKCSRSGGGLHSEAMPNYGSGATIVNGVIVSPATPSNGSGRGAATSSSLPSSSAIFLSLTLLLHITTNLSMASLHMLPYSQVNLWNTCVLGLSGILFGYFSFGCYSAPPGAQMLFCGFPMPALAFPWVMLLCTFLMIPSASFAGHFFGVVWGILFARVPPLTTAMRCLGSVFGRTSVVVCPAFMTFGGTSRGSSPNVFNYFSSQDGGGTTGDPTTAANASREGGGGGHRLGSAASGSAAPFRMAGPAHPNVAGSNWAVQMEEGNGGGTAIPTGIVVAAPATVGNAASAAQPAGLTPFQGEGRKLGSGNA